MYSLGGEKLNVMPVYARFNCGPTECERRNNITTKFNELYKRATGSATMTMFFFVDTSAMYYAKHAAVGAPELKALLDKSGPKRKSPAQDYSIRSADNVCGYDRYYVFEALKVNRNRATNDNISSLTPSEDEKKNIREVRKAFRKDQKNSFINRDFIEEFTKLIA
jgi:hypothetical protein